ncbi:hypothetical protein GRAN_1007 [Granulicella sibirica]|uniref:Uncharacterized protein n=1 Tax=Granulicella sibirica TaxID=2479048 RepID=A0A4Q0T363_9BACT|nr:hypothetical protein GRAN_1007 [Granulicella sibirica]
MLLHTLPALSRSFQTQEFLRPISSFARLLLSHTGPSGVIILGPSHSIFEGKSLAFAMRDLLQMLSWLLDQIQSALDLAGTS